MIIQAAQHLLSVSSAKNEATSVKIVHQIRMASIPRYAILCQVWFSLFVSVRHGFRVEVSLIIDFCHKNVEII
jgi:hypothetical protein